MSIQLYLVFNSITQYENVKKKYNWEDSWSEIVDTDTIRCLKKYCVCAFYGDNGFTHGIGSWQYLTYSILGNSRHQLNQYVNEINQISVNELKTTYHDVMSVLDNVIEWVDFIRDNINTLNNIGFLLHWDVDDDFSRVVFAQKDYSHLKIIDLLTVQEDVVLWITKD